MWVCEKVGRDSRCAQANGCRYVRKLAGTLDVHRLMDVGM